MVVLVEHNDKSSLNKHLLICSLFPEVTKEDLNELPGQFCVGRRNEIDFTDKEIFIQQSEGNFDKIADITEDILTMLKEDDPENVESIDGGPACFGDSGEFSNFPFCFLVTHANGTQCHSVSHAIGAQCHSVSHAFGTCHSVSHANGTQSH